MYEMQETYHVLNNFISYFQFIEIIDLEMVSQCAGFTGTGVVTSVPSDAPDDFAALRDLKNKQVKHL